MARRRPVASWGGRIAAALAVMSSLTLLVGAMRRGGTQPRTPPPAARPPEGATPVQADEHEPPGAPTEPHPVTTPVIATPAGTGTATTRTAGTPLAQTSTTTHVFAALAVAVLSTIAAIPVAAAAGHDAQGGQVVAAAEHPRAPALSAFHAPQPLQATDQGTDLDGPSVRMPMGSDPSASATVATDRDSAEPVHDETSAAADAGRSPEAPAPAPDAQPVRITIPSIDVDAPLIEVGLDATRAVEVPAETDTVGWYTGGPRPGEVGPAMVVGHVDSHLGAAVFFRLRELAQGAVVEVRYDDGSRWRFTVSDGAAIDKDTFPVREVLANTDGPELRLITCGGAFDAATGHYTQNIVVWARGGTPVVPAVLA